MKRALVIAVLAILAAGAAAETTFIVGGKSIVNETPFYGRSGLDAVRWQQLIVPNDGVAEGDLRRWEWHSSGGGTPGEFQQFKVQFLEVNRSGVTLPFNSNYENQTPVVIASGDPFVLDAPDAGWFGFDITPSFNYTGRSLLVEVWWSGDTEGGTQCYAKNATGESRCVYACIRNSVNVNGYPNQGKIYNWLHYMRFTVSPIAVEPTSLGRVRALFR
jgi:hypothetical protein